MLQKSAARGFTLVEFLITAVVLGGATYWLSHTNFNSLRSAQEARLRFLITKGVLEYELEHLRAQPFATLAPVGFTDVGAAPSVTPPMTTGITAVTEVVAAVSCGGCSVTYSVQETTPNIRLVTVRVVWVDPSQRRRTNFLNTMVSQ